MIIFDTLCVWDTLRASFFFNIVYQSASTFVLLVDSHSSRDHKLSLSNKFNESVKICTSSVYFKRKTFTFLIKFVRVKWSISNASLFMDRIFMKYCFLNAERSFANSIWRSEILFWKVSKAIFHVSRNNSIDKSHENIRFNKVNYFLNKSRWYMKQMILMMNKFTITLLI